jgi:poly-gamma-glutamate synthesis protein (capsule biosynthesis protein)
MLSSEAEASSDIEASSDTGASSGTEPSPSPKAASAALKTSSSAKSHSSAKAPVKTTITISAAGDCTFGSDKSSPSSVNFYAVYNKVKKPSYFFQNVKKYFSKDDLTIVNLEGTLTKSQNRMDKTYAFRGNPSYVNILKKGSIEAVSFANNHCRDYGEQSYTDTIRTLKKAGIKYASYSTVSVYKTKGKKIGMIAVNGLFGLDYSKKLIASGMKKLKKKKADLIIVSMHAGTEHTNVLTSLQKQLAHYAVQKGANLVLGHHPHTLQGIEKYKGAYIVYSLANFCFGGNTNPVDKDTMIFQQTFTFSDDTLQKTNDIRIIPCSVSSKTTINNYQPTPLKGKKKQAVIKKLNTFSKSLGVQFKKNGTVK